MAESQAFEYLQYDSVGTYILRFSNRRNNFVFSVVLDSKEGKEVGHIIVDHKEDGFSIPGSPSFKT
jgi:hypothetical protein